MPGVITIYPKVPLPHRPGSARVGVFRAVLVSLLGLVCSCQGTQLVAVGEKAASGGNVATGGSMAVGGSSALGGSLALGGSSALGGSLALGGSTAIGGSSAVGGSSTTVSDPGMGGASAASSALGAGGSTPLPATRAKIGEPCIGDAECMSGICRGNKCAVPTCGARGESCTDGKDCCSGICQGSTCLNYDGPAVIGEPCTVAEECASKACADAGIGAGRRCQALEGCRPDGELCPNGADDCCSGYCVGQGDNATIKRCKFNKESLAPDSCILASGMFCDVQQVRCCGGGRGGTPTGTSLAPNCIPDYLGATRCHVNDDAAQPKDSYSCSFKDSRCSFSGDCCPAEKTPLLCRPLSDTALTCQPGCANTAGLCRADRDCCPGLTCVFVRDNAHVSGTCQALGLSCPMIGQSCTSPGSCCAGVCSEKFSGLPSSPGASTAICTLEQFDRGSM